MHPHTLTARITRLPRVLSDFYHRLGPPQSSVAPNATLRHSQLQPVPMLPNLLGITHMLAGPALGAVALLHARMRSGDCIYEASRQYEQYCTVLWLSLRIGSARTFQLLLHLSCVNLPC